MQTAEKNYISTVLKRVQMNKSIHTLTFNKLCYNAIRYANKVYQKKNNDIYKTRIW